jgi:hyperosmotically inducible periplasmic protein
MKNNANSVLLCLVLASAAGCGQGQDTHAADNTKKNERDRSGQTLTPTDQSESKSDIALTKVVRQALIADASLSTDAKNIKVISQNGKVTLRGVVANQDEKESILAKVRALPEVQGCDDQLEAKNQ